MNNITWDEIIGNIRILLAEYYEKNPPEETLTVDDADKISENIADYVGDLGSGEVLERALELKLYLED